MVPTHLCLLMSSPPWHEPKTKQKQRLGKSIDQLVNCVVGGEKELKAFTLRIRSCLSQDYSDSYPTSLKKWTSK